MFYNDKIALEDYDCQGRVLNAIITNNVNSFKELNIVNKQITEDSIPVELDFNTINYTIWTPRHISLIDTFEDEKNITVSNHMKINLLYLKIHLFY